MRYFHSIKLSNMTKGDKMKAFTKVRITKQTGYDFSNGARNLQITEAKTSLKLINGTLFIKFPHEDWKILARVFELQTESYQKEYMKVIEDALRTLKDCKKLKWEMAKAMEDAKSNVFDNQFSNDTLFIDHYTKPEIIATHATVIRTIEEHRNELYKIVGVPEYKIQNKLGKTHIKNFKDNDECFEWIENTLDLSQGWSFSKIV